jgi:hypothetical protein
MGKNNPKHVQLGELLLRSEVAVYHDALRPHRRLYMDISSFL